MAGETERTEICSNAGLLTAIGSVAIWNDVATGLNVVMQMFVIFVFKSKLSLTALKEKVPQPENCLTQNAREVLDRSSIQKLAASH